MEVSLGYYFCKSNERSRLSEDNLNGILRAFDFSDIYFVHCIDVLYASSMNSQCGSSNFKCNLMKYTHPWFPMLRHQCTTTCTIFTRVTRGPHKLAYEFISYVLLATRIFLTLFIFMNVFFALIKF